MCLCFTSVDIYILNVGPTDTHRISLFSEMLLSVKANKTSMVPTWSVEKILVSIRVQSGKNVTTMSDTGQRSRADMIMSAFENAY